MGDVKLSSVYTNGLWVICINWLRGIVDDYVAIRKDRNGAGQAFTLRARTCFIHCWPWLHLSTMAWLSINRKFSRLLILQSPWRAVCEGSVGPLKRPLKFGVNVSALCSQCGLWAPALSLFTRCWSNVASCWAFSASGSPVSIPSVSVLTVSTLWLFALGEGSRPAISYYTTGGHHPLRGCVFWIPWGPESLKWSVLRRACWEEGGHSRWQRVRVGQLS